MTGYQTLTLLLTTPELWSGEVDQIFNDTSLQFSTQYNYQHSSSDNIFIYPQSYSLYTKLTGKPLTPDVAFAALAVFSQMTLPLYLMPNVFIFHINAIVSTGRLRAFFEAPEIEKPSYGNGQDGVRMDGSINREVTSDSRVIIQLIKQDFEILISPNCKLITSLLNHSFTEVHIFENVELIYKKIKYKFINDKQVSANQVTKKH